MTNNSVELKSIGSLLNGKNHFYIPAYQRGYRWRGKQIEDLLGDLLSFKLSPTGNFYCLQPIIVRPIPYESHIRSKILKDKAEDTEINLWEVVDGQQRLTTIYILLKCLLQLSGEDLVTMYDRNFFEIYYESKPSFLEVLSSDIDDFGTIKDNVLNIDEAHVQSACYVIKKWMEPKGKGNQLSAKYKGGTGLIPKKLYTTLLELLTEDSDEGVLKVIWYQLNETGANPVEEFIKINNGKIPLLDSELVKALFLQRYDDGNIEHSISGQRGFQWEQMENRLNSSDFWSFISTLEDNEEDRMGHLLKIVYFADPNIQNKNTLEDGDIFRYFYNKIEGKNSDREKNLEEAWEQIMDAFNALEDWFVSPLIYNYVGYLVNNGYEIEEIYKDYQTLLKGTSTVIEEDSINDTDKSPKDFKNLLIQKVKESLSDIKIRLQNENTKSDNEDTKTKNEEIELEYSSKNVPLIRKVFMFLNIYLLTSQYESIIKKIDKYHNDISIFRFPFDLYKEQGWDVEHIDSQTTNPLTSIDDQKDWIKGALFDLNPTLTQSQKESITKELDLIDEKKNIEEDSELCKLLSDGIMTELKNRNYKNVIQLIEDLQETDRNIKDQIGNLTLLDSATNRSYKNALFCSKRKKIIEAVSNGRYVLPATQYVFMKFFDEDTVSPQNRTKWTGYDAKRHHDFILKTLKQFLPDAQ